MTDALVLEMTGIFVSGVIGPVFVSFAVRRAEHVKWFYEAAERSRDELHALVEEGAKLVAEGSVAIRRAAEAHDRHEAEPPEVGEWVNRMYILGQRLQLRLTPDDPVVTSLEGVTKALSRIAETDGTVAARTDFAAAQRHFLEVSRAALETRSFSPTEGGASRKRRASWPSSRSRPSG